MAESQISENPTHSSVRRVRESIKGGNITEMIDAILQIDLKEPGQYVSFTLSGKYREPFLLSEEVECTYSIDMEEHLITEYFYPIDPFRGIHLVKRVSDLEEEPDEYELRRYNMVENLHEALGSSVIA